MSHNIGLHHAVKAHKPVIGRLRDALKRPQTIDHFMIIVAITFPLTSVPQIVKIMLTQNIESISLVAYVLKIFFSVPWIYYGYLKKNPPILWTNALWLVMHAVVTAEFIYLSGIH